jgi:hypothetical protein
MSPSVKSIPLPHVAKTERFVNDRYRDEIRNDYEGLIRRIRATLDDRGMAILEDFIHPDFLAELRSTVDRLTPWCYEGGKRRPLVGSDLENTAFYEITFSDFIIRLTNDVLAGFNVHVDAADIHPVVNILVGKQGQEGVNAWHFDATYLTIAMPVVMPPPAVGRDGKFRIWPNVRRFSQSSWRNRLYWKFFSIDFLRRMVKNDSVNFVPGNLYFFYGFRSFHGTSELDPDNLRANCLMNFGGPFFDLKKGKIVQYAK